MSDETQPRSTHPRRTTAGKLLADSSPPMTLPLDKVEAAIRSIQYGVVQVIIQDGLIVQIDKTEKMRLR